MKKYLFLLLMVLPLAFIGCSSDDDDDNDNGETPEMKGQTARFLLKQLAWETPLRLEAFGEKITIDWGDGIIEMYENVSKNNITHTYSSNGLYEVNISSNNLETLIIYGNINYEFKGNLQLGSFPTLDALGLIGIRNITSFSTSNCPALESLIVLYCADLTDLDISKSTKLISMDCSYNNLKSLDISKNTDLEFLTVGGNKNLEALDLSKNVKLTDLFAFNNNLKSLDLTANKALTFVDCSENLNCETLYLEGCTNLERLVCNKMKLTALAFSDISSKLVSVNIEDNKFAVSELDILLFLLPAAERMGYSSIHLAGNPGSATCNTTILGPKGWIVASK